MNMSPEDRKRLRNLHNMIDANDLHPASGVIACLKKIDLGLPETPAQYVRDVLGYALGKAQSVEDISYDRLADILSLQASRTRDNEIISNIRREAAQANKALERCSDDLAAERRRANNLDEALRDAIGKYERMKEERNKLKSELFGVRSIEKELALQDEEFDELEKEAANLTSSLTIARNANRKCSKMLVEKDAVIQGLEHAFNILLDRVMVLSREGDL